MKKSGETRLALSPQPITVRVAVAVQMLGLSRSKFYMLMSDGEFEIVKVGRCTLVVVASLQRFVDRQRN
jgi:hypothetical protein